MTITNITRNLGIAFAVLFVVAVSVSFAPIAQAADFPLPMGGDGEADIISATPIYPVSYGASWDGEADIISATPIYQPSYSDSLWGGSTYGGGYSFGGGGWSNSGFGFGGSSGFAGNSTSYVANNGNSYINAPTTVNAPTTITNSGNTTITNPVVPTQVVYTQPPVYTPPSYPIYPIPTRQPYVSLTAVPYTGLDLGPLGTVAYWSFLVVWCLIAAYLIIVKKVQNTLVAGLNSVLFGGATHAVAHNAPVKHTAHASHSHNKAHAVVVEEDAIDPFILSQINRA